MLKINAPVSIVNAENYEYENILRSLERLFMETGFTAERVKGKRIVIKPNLVRKSEADKAIITNPSLVRAAGEILKKMGALSVTLAESPGGMISEGILRSLYDGCGIKNAAEKAGIVLSYDIEGELIHSDRAKVCRAFNVLQSIMNADIVINICKLKTHELTLMSAATKNFFGVIPGIEKFEMHARFTTREDFSEMLCDLVGALSEKKEMLNIVDAVVGMEGSGPTAGKPRKMGFVAASENPFTLDRVMTYVLGIEGRVLYVNYAVERGYTKADIADIEVMGNADAVRVFDLDLPDTEKTSSLRFSSRFLGGKTIKLFEPKPFVTNLCVGCGVCVRSCPMHMISINKKRRAVINRSGCIKCYCCQELCPHTAIKIKKNFILRIIK